MANPSMSLIRFRWTPSEKWARWHAWNQARPAAEYGRAEGRLVVLGGFAQRAEVEREQVVASGLTSVRIAAPNRLAPASVVGIF